MPSYLLSVGVDMATYTHNRHKHELALNRQILMHHTLIYAGAGAGAGGFKCSAYPATREPAMEI